MPMNSRAAFHPVGSSSSSAGGTSSALASMVTWTLALSLRARGRSGLSTPSSYTASTSIVMALTSEAYCTVTPAQPGPLPGAASEQRPDANPRPQPSGCASAGGRGLPLHVCKLLVEHRIHRPRCRPLPLVVSLLSLQVTVDLFAMPEVEGDRAVHLLERQDREGLRDAFGRLAGDEGANDGVERHPGSRDSVRPGDLFHVGVAHGRSYQTTSRPGA